jgi:hypothetical protein
MATACIMPEYPPAREERQIDHTVTTTPPESSYLVVPVRVRRGLSDVGRRRNFCESLQVNCAIPLPVTAETALISPASPNSYFANLVESQRNQVLRPPYWMRASPATMSTVPAQYIGATRSAKMYHPNSGTITIPNATQG